MSAEVRKIEVTTTRKVTEVAQAEVLWRLSPYKIMRLELKLSDGGKPMSSPDPYVAEPRYDYYLVRAPREAK